MGAVIYASSIERRCANMPRRRRAAYGKRMALPSGLTAAITVKVEEGDTALAIGSGGVPVLATPRLVTLLEQASVEAIAGRLGADKTSVGYEVQLAHLSPTPVGSEVTAEATLESVE